MLLHRLGIIGPSTPLSGASSGSLIAVFTKCGLPVEQVLQLTQEFSQVGAALATVCGKQPSGSYMHT